MPSQAHCDTTKSICLGMESKSKSLKNSGKEKYLEVAEKCWEECWDLLQHEEGWVTEAGHNTETGRVLSKKIKNLGKVFKLEALLDATPEEVFDVLVTGVVDWPKWNKTILECKHIKKINENTDIAYSVGASQLGGLVSSRDFCNLRHWKSRDNIMIAAACGVKHPDCPVSKHHVRAQNRPASYVFVPVPNEPGKCHFYCFLNTDLKGWLPQWMIDQAMSGVLTDYLKHLKQYLIDRRT